MIRCFGPLACEEAPTPCRTAWRKPPSMWGLLSSPGVSRKGERIIDVRTLMTGISRTERSIENISSGQYL